MLLCVAAQAPGMAQLQHKKRQNLRHCTITAPGKAQHKTNTTQTHHFNMQGLKIALTMLLGKDGIQKYCYMLLSDLKC
jgi:hypothetical protein